MNAVVAEAAGTFPNIAEPRAAIFALQSAMLKLEKIELPLAHHFAPGLYSRAMFIPKGAALVGKIHKTEHLCMVMQGKIRVADENGTRDIEAPAIFVSQPGTKRAGYALEDTVWVCVHHNPWNETDLDKLEAELIVPELELLEDQS